MPSRPPSATAFAGPPMSDEVMNVRFGFVGEFVTRAANSSSTGPPTSEAVIDARRLCLPSGGGGAGGAEQAYPPAQAVYTRRENQSLKGEA
eukprot:400747-Prorocentrum_minimum.AAC.1